MSVARNLALIEEALVDSQVKLIAVTKKASPSQMEEAFRLGVTEFGENRIQDALAKRNELSPKLVQDTNWHFIGHLQTNKVKQAVENFSMIQSVDSFKLAKEISKVASKKEIEQSILLQVKMLEDPEKSGFAPSELKKCFSDILALSNIKICGLMTITPLNCDQAERRECFNGTKNLKEELEREHSVKLRELSMGMSDDWSEAISCGATMIRVGRAIFAN